jgi:hypothetical protein
VITEVVRSSIIRLIMSRQPIAILAVALVATAASTSNPKAQAQLPRPIVEVYPGPTGNNNYLSKLYTVEVFDGTTWLSSYTYTTVEKAKFPGTRTNIRA